MVRVRCGLLVVLPVMVSTVVLCGCSPDGSEADLQRRANPEAEEKELWAKKFEDLERSLRVPFDFFCKIVPGAQDFDSAVASYNEAQRAAAAVEQQRARIRIAVAISSDPALESLLTNAHAAGFFAAHKFVQWLQQHAHRLEAIGRYLVLLAGLPSSMTLVEMASRNFPAASKARRGGAILRQILLNRTKILSTGVGLQRLGRNLSAKSPWMAGVVRASRLLSGFFGAYATAASSCDISNFLIAFLQASAAENRLKAIQARMPAIDAKFCCAVFQKNGRWPPQEIANCTPVKASPASCPRVLLE